MVDVTDGYVYTADSLGDHNVRLWLVKGKQRGLVRYEKESFRRSRRKSL